MVKLDLVRIFPGDGQRMQVSEIPTGPSGLFWKVGGLSDMTSIGRGFTPTFNAVMAVDENGEGLLFAMVIPTR